MARNWCIGASSLDAVRFVPRHGPKERRGEKEVDAAIERGALPRAAVLARLDAWLADPLARRTLEGLVREVLGPCGSDPRVMRRRLEEALHAGDLIALREPRRRIVLALDDVIPLPPIGPKEEATTWFELNVVDGTGAPMDDLELLFSIDGERRRVQSDGAGRARIEGVTASFAHASIASVEAARKKLIARIGAPVSGDGAPPEGPSVQVEAVRRDMPPIALESAAPKTLVLVRPAYRTRLVGMFFETNKSFLLPSAMHGARGVLHVYARFPTSKMLVVGHADAVADDAYNLALSLERAEAIAAYLSDDVSAWESWFQDSKAPQKRWGTREIQHMLTALPEGKAPFYEGKPSGEKDKKTREAVKRFQAWSNETRGTSLAKDGNAGKDTRREIVASYMELDGTTVPEGVELVPHGCGEFFPEEPTENGVAEPENRRVEVFHFDGEIAPPPPGKTSARGSTEYPAWRKQVVETIDLRHGGLTVRVLGDDDAPLAEGLVTLSGPRGDQATTSKDGIVHFFDLPDGTYTLRAERGGFDSAVGVVTLPLLAPPPPITNAESKGGEKLGAKEETTSAKGAKSPKTETSTDAAPTTTKTEPIQDVKLTRVVEIVVHVRDHVGAPLRGALVLLRVATSKVAKSTPTPPFPKDMKGKAITDDRGRAKFALAAGDTLGGNLVFDVFHQDSPFAGTQVTVPNGDFIEGGKLKEEIAKCGKIVVAALLDVVHVTKRRYYWQNEKIRDVIYPIRRPMLRRFLFIYRKIELSNEPTPVLSESEVERIAGDLPDVVARLSKVPSGVGEMAKLTEAQWQARDVGLTFYPVAVTTKEKDLRAALRANPRLCKAYLYFKDELEKSDHTALMKLVSKRFDDDPTKTVHPAWVRYMVVHFSGMRYESGHANEAAFGRPQSLLEWVRREEVPEELAVITDDGKGDEAGVELLLEARRVLAEDDGKRKKAADAKFAQGLLTELRAKMAALDPIVQRDWTAAQKPLDKKDRKLLRDALFAFHVRYYGGDKVVALTKEQALGILTSRFASTKGSDAARTADAIFPDVMERDVTVNTQLLADVTFTPDWTVSFDPKSTAIPRAWRSLPSNKKEKASKWFRALEAWKTRGAAATSPSVRFQENSGAWRTYHHQTLEPIVTRAVCNEISEMALHLRGCKEPGVIGGGGMGPKGNGLPLFSHALDNPAVAAADGVSIVYSRWGNYPEEDRPKISSAEPPNANITGGLIEPTTNGMGGGGPLQTAKDAASVGVSPAVLSTRWISAKKGEKTIPVTHKEKKIDKSGKETEVDVPDLDPKTKQPLRVKVETARLLIFHHEAAHVGTYVGSKDGKVRSVSFETAVPTGINEPASGAVPGRYVVLWSGADLTSPAGDPRVDDFLEELLEPCDPDPSKGAAGEVIASSDDDPGELGDVAMA